jgi:RND family efflux transporter MFP subunit
MVFRRAFDNLSFLLPVGAGVAIAVLGLLVQETVVDRSGSAAAQAPGTAVVPAPDTPGAHVATVTDLLGVVVAPDLVEVAARTEGTVTMIAAQLGDRVERGAVLARIDDRNLRDQLAAARAAMHALVADREKAESELEEARERRSRSERLSYVVSDEELARVRYEAKYAASRLQGTRARIDEQQTRVAILERSIDEAQVRAPFAGSVAARYVGLGATVSPGTHIVRLVSAGEVLVRFAIPEALGAPVHVGMSIAVDVDSAALSGTVDKLAPEVDAASRMIVAEARVRVPAALSDMSLVGRVARVRVTVPAAAEESAP